MEGLLKRRADKGLNVIVQRRHASRQAENEKKMRGRETATAAPGSRPEGKRSRSSGGNNGQKPSEGCPAASTIPPASVRPRAVQRPRRPLAQLRPTRLPTHRLKEGVRPPRPVIALEGERGHAAAERFELPAVEGDVPQPQISLD